jgi:very-short-patch-repair endonuclease
VIEDIALSTFSFSKYLMWKDLVDRTDDLRNNRLVAHLVDNPDKAFDTGQSDAVRPEDLDAKFTPKDLVTPLPADSSQLAAVVAAQEGRDFVLIGPPGTGKSQTIANIICQCLAHGKTVLFVAEKAAALDVVQRRLEQYGLGEAVLELHSNKTDRKRVLNQLGRGWDRASGGRDDGWHYINNKLRVERDKLNDYVDALHAKGTQGFSIYEALGWTAAEPKGFALEFASEDAHDVQTFKNLEDIADVLDRTHTATKDIPPMTLITAEDWSYAWQDEILAATRQLRTDTDWMVTAGQTLLSRLGLLKDAEITRETAATLTQLSKRMESNAQDLRHVPDLPVHDLDAALKTFSDAAQKFETGRAGLSATYDEQDILRMPLDQMDNDWRMANAAIWPKSALKRRGIRKLLQSYAKTGNAAPEGDIPALHRMRDQLNILNDHPVAPMAGPERSIAQATELANQANSLRSALALLQDDIADTVAYGAARAALIARPTDKLADALADWHVAQDTFVKAKTRFETAGGHVPQDMPPTDLMREIDVVLANRDRLTDWTRWREARTKADAAGLSALADKLEAGETTAPAKETFRRAYARWWLPLALDASDPLRQFVHWDHEQAIQAFRDLDDKAADLAPIEVMRRINHKLPTRDGVPRNSELGTLRHQLGLQRPSMPIRTLLGNLTETLPRLAPCVLMSPLSIAQYLPAGQAVFDLVIFDEASQITTWDAVGAIARARQSIVVGDPKQLPPTNFFGRADDGGDDEDPLLGDMPSILDEVANAGIPTRQLDWHYRSRDEALIAFSNHHYYGDRLVTFPAPSTGSEAVRFHDIGGTYARGSGRINQDEAKTIVAMIAKRLSDWIKLDQKKRPTLGVITFNAQQQGLILDLLDDLRRKRTDLEWFFEEDRIEPVIVKNLENIQGDERDVMLFSITFGPDLAGKLSMAFGALNQDGGEKRLNVAVTRARRELHVFASITADQIDLSRTRALGVRHLKAFLDYAQRGAVALPAADEGSLGPAENPFEDAIAEAFRAKGWEVRTQIGVSGFRIDLGIVNPDRAGAYLAGIECDGATYHSSATARDRDKVRQAVLEGLGWTILRIWSTDWFRDAGSVVARLHAQLEEALAEFRAKAKAEEDAKTPPAPPDDKPRSLPEPEGKALLLAEQAAVYLPKPVLGPNDDTTNSTPPEEKEVLPLFASVTEPNDDLNLSPDSFFETSYLPTLRTLVDQILAQQGPMPFDVLAREITRLSPIMVGNAPAGGSMTGSKLQRGMPMKAAKTGVPSFG